MRHACVVARGGARYVTSNFRGLRFAPRGTARRGDWLPGRRTLQPGVDSDGGGGGRRACTGRLQRDDDDACVPYRL